MKRVGAAGLVLLYPPAWRAEYGAEFRDVLEAAPLTTGVVLDVVCNAIIQRIRLDEPWKVLGIACLLLVFVYTLLTPLGVSWFAAGAATASIPLPVIVGFWTVLRQRCVGNRGGGAAVRFALLAAWVPYLLLGFLIASGADLPRGAHSAIPAVGLSLPAAWVLGWLGGSAARILLWSRAPV